MLPPVAVQITPVLLLFATVAVNVVLAFGASIVVVGLMLTATGGGAVTVTVADAVFVASATLVAVTEYVPADPGAVYRPELDIVPPEADQVTAVFDVFVTVAVNCCVAPVWIETEDGATDTLTTGAVTVTLAVADLVESAAL